MVVVVVVFVEVVEEKIEFDVIFEEVFVDKKIVVLKVVCIIIGLGLKEVKELVEFIFKVIKEVIGKDDVEVIKK